jgi:hypothetical protein
MAQISRLDRLEARHADTGDSGGLASRLAKARSTLFQPTHTKAELEQHAERDDLTGRIARGLLRLGERFYLPDDAAPGRELPELDVEDTLIAVMGALSLDPEGFADFQGWELRRWQRKLLRGVREELADLGLVGFDAAIRRAVSSGHGVGKSALVAILILWALSTHEDARVVITANTEGQLTSKTMPELAKWHRLAINREWFIFTATSLYSADEQHEKNWRADAVPWNESRPESFAGLHNQGKRIVLIFDEGSAIADSIYVVGENALTDAGTQMLWLICGNPTRASGYFRECLDGKFAHRWSPIFIDRRDVEGVSQAETNALLEAYGVDSYQAHVRVYGKPPPTDDVAFFNRAEAEEAMRRPVVGAQRGHPMVIGVDVARRGADASVLTFRHHLDARSFAPVKLYGLDLMALAARVAAEANKFRGMGQQVVLMVDGTGLGAGVVDRLRQLGFARNVVDVQFAAKAPDPAMAANLRAWMHLELRLWIRKGGALPNDQRLLEQMAAIEYGNTQTGQILLERKDDLRDRLGYSPDELDSIACTFATPVAVDVEGGERARRTPRDYDPVRQMERELER